MYAKSWSMPLVKELSYLEKRRATSLSICEQSHSGNNCRTSLQ